MDNKTYKEIKNKINNESCLTSNNRKILHNMNKFLFNYKNKEQLKIPIMVLIKDIDINSITYIEKLIEEMLKQYKIFGNKLQNMRDYWWWDLEENTEKEKAYKLIIDEENSKSDRMFRSY